MGTRFSSLPEVYPRRPCPENAARTFPARQFTPGSRTTRLTRPPPPPSDLEYTPARSAERHRPEAHWRNPSILSLEVTATGTTKRRPWWCGVFGRRCVRVGVWDYSYWFAGLRPGETGSGRSLPLWLLRWTLVRVISLESVVKTRPPRLLTDRWRHGLEKSLAGQGFRGEPRISAFSRLPAVING